MQPCFRFRFDSLLTSINYWFYWIGTIVIWQLVSSQEESLDLESGCIRNRDDRLSGWAESWTDLCHPTFAMAGALAWQVKKINKKKRDFLVWWGDSMGLFLPRVSSPLCGVCPAFFLALLFYICSFCSSQPDESQILDNSDNSKGIICVNLLLILSLIFIALIFSR